MILERHEVGNIHPYDMLTTKMQTKLIATKLFPKSLLCNSHLLSVLDGVVFNSSISQCISSSPTSKSFQTLTRRGMLGSLFWDGRALRNEVLHIYNFLPFFVQHFTSIIILTPPPSEGLGEAFDYLSLYIFS